MNKLCLVIFIFASQPAIADLDQTMDKLCAKTKSCGLAELEKQGIAGEMIDVMSSMFDGMCKGWLAPYAQSVGEAGLEDMAESCIDSMASQSCGELMESQGEFASKACVEFKAEAEKAGILEVKPGLPESTEDNF